MLRRSFSQASKLQKKLNKDEIAKALSLLKGTSSLNGIDVTSEQEKHKYISYFTRALNSNIGDSADDLATVKSHFTHSLLGLNTILNVNNKTHLDPISIKDSVSRCTDEKQVLEIFDELLTNETLDIKSFKHILTNKHVQDLDYIYSRLQFVHSDELKILVCSRALMQKKTSFAQDVYEDNLGKWLMMREEAKLSQFSEKSLYQVIWRIDKDISLLQRLSYTQASYLMLIETIPRQLPHLPAPAQFQFTSNQRLFLKFVNFINKKPITSTSNKLLQRLLRLNVEAMISREVDDEMTIHKYRYVNGLVDLCDDLQKEYGDASELYETLHSLHDVIQHETVLKFI